jgi:serine/threonine protein kinase
MERIWPANQDTAADLANRETVLEAPNEGEASTRWAFRGIEQLVGNYRAIVKMRALFYPSAYRFGRELGRGRQGVVFLAFRHGARGCMTRHALKLFDPGIYGTVRKYWTDMGRIANQISRLQSVNAPNLVGRDIYEEANGVGYVQMEAIDGLDIQHLLYGDHFARVRARSTPEEWARFSDVIFRFEDGRVRIQPGVALYIMRQSLRGLEALHDAGFVHCDIKPSNLMCDKIGIVKVVDYGRANFVSEKITFLLGSPVYMAPEIHRRETYLVQSDLYSVGLVGIEMLRGESVVHPRLSEEDMLKYKLQLPPRLPELLPPHVRRNRDFVALLQRMIHPDPAQRFANAEEAESGSEGLALLHKQLTMLGKDSEYDRDLESYVSKLFAEGASATAHEGMLT